MGAFRDKPMTEKVLDKGEGFGIKWGVSAMQGWRMEMEDAHVCNTDFGLKNHGFFGVFDGHAGPKVSLHCSEHLLETVMNQLFSSKAKPDEFTVKALQDGIKKGFFKLDETLRELPQWASGEDRSGTTAIVTMVTPDYIIWANCGDSRGILCRGGKFEFATVDHKPYNPLEKKRIELAGGTVMMQRVNGSLAVSRALGDFDYKRSTDLPPEAQLVSPEPEITVQARDYENDQFLLLACDGVFDVMTNEEVVAYVLHHLQLTDDLSQICSDLIDTCLHKNSRDNMSVVLVTFPKAPQVSQEEIEKEEKLQREAKEAIKEQIKKRAEAANDPLELEENYIIESLTKELPANYDVVGKRPFVSELCAAQRKEKFGSINEEDEEMNFSGLTDASDAPHGFQVAVGNQEFIIQGVMESDDRMDASPPQSPGKDTVQATGDDSSPAQTLEQPLETDSSSTSSDKQVET